MFDIGWSERVVVGIVALIVIGPRELPATLRTIGQMLTKVRRMAAEFQGQFQDAMREAELAELKKQAEDLKSSVSDVGNFDPLADTQRQIENAFDETAKPELSKPETQDAANAADPVPAPTPDVTLPEPVEPAEAKDFATIDTPPPKQAGGSA